MKISTATIPDGRIWFRYDLDSQNLRRVSALLGTGPRHEASVCAHATCAAGDRFDKKVGRKLALRRLLQNLRLPRSERSQVWEAYWTYVRL